MKRNKLVFIGLTLLLILGVATPSYASESLSSLKKQITSLKAQNTSISNENKKLKAQVSSLSKQLSTSQSEVSSLKAKIPVVSTGSIYKDGVSSGTSSFVSVGAENYVEIEKLIPVVTNYDHTKVNFNKINHNLYLGIQPRNGIINLTKLSVYDNHSAVQIGSWDGTSLFVNNKKFSWGLESGVWRDQPKDITYKLNGNYSTLNFSYGIDDDSDTNVGSIVIYGDDNVIFDSGDMERLDDAKQAQVDVIGIKYLTIQFKNSGVDTTIPVLGEPVLIP